MHFLQGISIRLLLFNVLLVFLPAAGFLYLDVYERELLARVKVLFRRAAIDQNTTERPPAEAPVRHGDLELDLQRYSVRWKGMPLSLTVTEFMMLHALVRFPGHVKTRKQLHQDGYPHDAYVSDRTIDSHIKRVRRKFEEADPSFERIETVYGLGYRWKE